MFRQILKYRVVAVLCLVLVLCSTEAFAWGGGHYGGHYYRGGYTAITLKKWGNGFIGPQGEYYSEHPTVEQLKTLYGK